MAIRIIHESENITEFVINETYANEFGFPHTEDAINKQLEYKGNKIPIVGVMHDFH